MAVDITVSLTDAEQAIVTEVAARVAPAATSAEILAWAAVQAKAGLRAAVMAERARFDESDAVALRAARAAEADSGFPDPNGG
jgi:hypothetical protein